ncbi:hypothetical protein PSEHALCIP103_03570 [Pseudoalteromonas haloplanktis]|uniref:Uncharacterized protein n=1 Tax=Pseudoalteromonas haloplanktis TaxID=228 RepID=A0A9W4VZW3_PSEHA|nr:hypothetical protein PSEHALCIP103_03570 [Pseudoalteromonas haloplanktis]
MLAGFANALAFASWQSVMCLGQFCGSIHCFLRQFVMVFRQVSIGYPSSWISQSIVQTKFRELPHLVFESVRYWFC